MATITNFKFFRHLRADPGMHIIHYSAGKITKNGRSLAYFYLPLSASIAEIPLFENEIMFAFSDQLTDYQPINIQGVVSYKITDVNAAADAYNFGIDPVNGAYLDQPVEKISNIVSQLAHSATRPYLMSHNVQEALTTGAEPLQSAIFESLSQAQNIQKSGLMITSVRVLSVKTSADLEKAFQTPMREQIQQRADEAAFQRRAMAVEKERAIKENELSTQIELEKKNEQLIRLKGDNKAHDARAAATAARISVEGEVERQNLLSKGDASNTKTKSDAEAESIRTLGLAQGEMEKIRADLYAKTPRHVLSGMALFELSSKMQSINHLNLTPNLAADLFGDFLRDQGEKSNGPTASA